MKYSVKIKDGKKVIQGTYIPNGYSCKCKSCNFTIEVPVDSDEEEVNELIEKLRTL